MGRGTHRGFITYEELSKSLGKRNLSDQNLAQAFLHILVEKITLVEKKSDFKVLRKKENSNKESKAEICFNIQYDLITRMPIYHRIRGMPNKLIMIITDSPSACKPFGFSSSNEPLSNERNFELDDFK